MNVIKNGLFWIDENAERVLMNLFYSYLALIIFIEVVRRFVFHTQTSWGSTTAIHAFVWISWLGCAFCIKKRNHLRFPGIRSNISHTAQFYCFLLDDLIWLIIAAVVLVSSIKLVSLQIMIGQTIEGTDNVPQWLATISIPVGFSLVVIRVFQDVIFNIKTYKLKEPFMKKPEEETLEELEQY